MRKPRKKFFSHAYIPQSLIQEKSFAGPTRNLPLFQADKKWTFKAAGNRESSFHPPYPWKEKQNKTEQQQLKSPTITGSQQDQRFSFHQGWGLEEKELYDFGWCRKHKALPCLPNKPGIKNSRLHNHKCSWRKIFLSEQTIFTVGKFCRPNPTLWVLGPALCHLWTHLLPISWNVISLIPGWKKHLNLLRWNLEELRGLKARHSCSRKSSCLLAEGSVLSWVLSYSTFRKGAWQWHKMQNSLGAYRGVRPIGIVKAEWFCWFLGVLWVEYA